MQQPRNSPTEDLTRAEGGPTHWGDACRDLLCCASGLISAMVMRSSQGWEDGMPELRSSYDWAGVGRRSWGMALGVGVRIGCW